MFKLQTYVFCTCCKGRLSPFGCSAKQNLNESDDDNVGEEASVQTNHPNSVRWERHLRKGDGTLREGGDQITQIWETMRVGVDEVSNSMH